MFRRTVLFSTLGLFVAFAIPAYGQPYPSRPIKLIVTVAPGTATDGIGRFVAEHLTHDLKVPVVVENRVGANGVVAAAQVAKAPADGYTLMMTASTHYVNGSLYARLPYDTLKSFKPVAMIASTSLMLVVPSSSPFNSLAELVDYMRKHPGKLTYASGGNGSTPHLAGALLASMAKSEALHVTYKGGNAAFADTVGGQVDMTFSAPLTAMAQVRAGRLKALATTGVARSSVAPEVPTVAESGFPGYRNVTTLGIMAPAGVSDDIVTSVSNAIRRITKTQEFVEFCKLNGLEPSYREAQAYARSSEEEFRYWEDLVKLSGAKAQ
jgi:tripartite-type tricarboxylate transporter receptor subunit TctC